MAEVLLVVGVTVVVWFVVAAVVALFLGRAVRLADDRHKAQLAYRRTPTRAAARPAARRVPVRAS